MALGPILDVPLLGIAIFLSAYFRRQIADWLLRSRLPVPLLYSLCAFVLIAIEEHVNCIPDWCLQVIIPPTTWFLLVEVIIFGLLARKTQRFWTPTVLFCIFGILFELILGPSKGYLFALPWYLSLFLSLWVGLSYLFIAALPLTLIQRANK